MAGRQVVVVEVNEVPRRVLVDVAAMGRASFFAERLGGDEVVETVMSEALPREMYPSQTWASFNTGVPWSDHRIWWYGDPKPEQYPLYWQVAAAEGRSVGLIGTLHSSPLTRQCRSDRFRFAIPDCFAGDADTIPARYRGFQQLNLRLTKANSRQSSLAGVGSELLSAVKVGTGLRLRPATMTRIAGLVAGVATGRVPRERLRSGQFLVLSDVFTRLLDQHRPDLAVVFTNHVAAAMHRYWYALYPDDFAADHYSEAWIERHHDEIPAAVELLDRFLTDLDAWCRAHDRTLLVVSSMGQGPSGRLESEVSHEAVVVDGARFLGAVGVGRAGPGRSSTSSEAEVWSGDRLLTDVDMPSVRGSMAPNLTLDCQSPVDAERIAKHLEQIGDGRPHWRVDRVDEVVTLTYDIEVLDSGHVQLNGVAVPADGAGLDIYQVDDHSSGRHIAEGVVAVSNSPSFKQPAEEQVDYLDFAPALLEHLGLQRLDHHRVPELQL